MRPGDEKTAIVLAMQAEMDELGLLDHERPESRPACGTARAAWAHRRHRELPLDGACAEAEREYWRAHLAARRPPRPEPWVPVPVTPQNLADIREMIRVLAEALLSDGETLKEAA